MTITRRDEIDTLDFNDILAALREVARNAGGTEHATEAEDEAVRRINLPALTPGDQP